MKVSIENGHHLNVKIDGKDDKPNVIFSNSLGSDLTMWDPQVEFFRNDFKLAEIEKFGCSGDGLDVGLLKEIDGFFKEWIEVLDQLEDSFDLLRIDELAIAERRGAGRTASETDRVQQCRSFTISE